MSDSLKLSDIESALVITDEDLDAIDTEARRSWMIHRTGVRGQMFTAADSWESHVAGATVALIRKRLIDSE